jgi:hypothetical protein
MEGLKYLLLTKIKINLGLTVCDWHSFLAELL